MSFLPEIFDTKDYGTNTYKHDVVCCQKMYSVQKNGNEDFKDLAQRLKPDLQMPHDADTALRLFLELNELVRIADEQCH